LIVSNDTMKYKPPYTITSGMVDLVAKISEAIGKIRTAHLYRQPAELRKKNRIRTIQSSLQIEGNTLTIGQVTDLLEHKKVIAPQKDILEVKNAIEVYNKIAGFSPYSLKAFTSAHGMLMNGLQEKPGHFRSKSVGIAKGKKVTHVAPPPSQVPALMKELFGYLKKDKEILLIKSCVFHYEMEFIHPFSDGNGRMGRLWQTLLLMQHHEIFGFLPVESLIKKRQRKYYDVLALSDKLGHSTRFVEFMLGIILESLEDLLSEQNKTVNPDERIEIYKTHIGKNTFTRKMYITHFNNISTATASRDLKNAVGQKILLRNGDKNKAVYKFKTQ
jgi:Fic family protein